MISDIISDAIGEIEDYQREMPDAYASIAEEIGVVKAVMTGLRMYLDAAPSESDELNKLMEEIRLAIRAIDVTGLVVAREKLLAWVETEFKQSPRQTQAEESVATDDADDGWHDLGAVTIDSAMLLLVDPVHQGRLECPGEYGQLAIPGGDFSAVQVPTGFGDGRYRVEGRVLNSPMFGHRIAEIRVRFLDENGNWLGADAPQESA